MITINTKFVSGPNIPAYVTAMWQCPRCQRVLHHSFSQYITYSLEGSLWCPCYDLLPPEGCVERRTITKMIPLNDAARQHEEAIRSIREYHETKAQAEREAHERAEDYRDSWGWAPSAQRFTS